MKLQRSAERGFAPGETIRLWVLGITAPIPTNAIEGLVNLFRLAVGQARPAGVLMTDRAVYVARTGWFRSQVRDVLARYSLEPSPPRVELEHSNASRVAIRVNDWTVYLPPRQLETAREIASAVATPRA